MESEQESLPEIERTKASHRIKVIEEDEENENDINENSAEDLSVSSEDTIDISSLFCDDEELEIRKMQSHVEGDSASISDNNFSDSSPSMSSTTSSDDCKQLVAAADKEKGLICDKHLSTILKLDKEHNLFGLAHISMIDNASWKPSHKDNDEPLFPQSAIVLTCCATGCCRHRSKSDLPLSLKCGSCGGCGACGSCVRPGCPICHGPCKKPAVHPPRCPTCPSGPPCSSPPSCSIIPCYSRCCNADCASCRGMKIVLHKKPVYEPTPVEIASRATSILQKPASARVCGHTPRCIPPSSCFPYLMPCYWPALVSAPCSNPERCFHNPPCPPPRRKMCANAGTCPPNTCGDPAKCPNASCPSKNSATK